MESLHVEVPYTRQILVAMTHTAMYGFQAWECTFRDGENDLSFWRYNENWMLDAAQTPYPANEAFSAAQSPNYAFIHTTEGIYRKSLDSDEKFKLFKAGTFNPYISAGSLDQLVLYNGSTLYIVMPDGTTYTKTGEVNTDGYSAAGVILSQQYLAWSSEKNGSQNICLLHKLNDQGVLVSTQSGYIEDYNRCSFWFAKDNEYIWRNSGNVYRHMYNGNGTIGSLMSYSSYARYTTGVQAYHMVPYSRTQSSNFPNGQTRLYMSGFDWNGTSYYVATDGTYRNNTKQSSVGIANAFFVFAPNRGW